MKKQEADSRLDLWLARSISWQDQEELLKTCLRTGQDLEGVLASEGLALDDLRYEYPIAPRLDSNGYRPFESLPTVRAGIPHVSLFSGAGGLDLGFEAAGFRTEVMVEVNEVFCKTLRANWPDRRVIGPPAEAGDVSDVDAVADALRRLGIRERFEGIFTGGPPCQPFSIAANQRFSKNGDKFKRVGFADGVRGNLLLSFVDLIERFRPRAFVIENVPGLLTIDGGEQLAVSLDRLSTAQYQIDGPHLLDVSSFGIPQFRKRLFVCGVRGGGKPLQFIKSGNSHTVLDALLHWDDSLPNHQTRRHLGASIDRYMRLRVGERDHLGRVDRLDPRRPSKTIIAGGSGGGGRSHLHPFIPRTLSPRECARLQTFPDGHVFQGPVARQFTQVGNAVPPKLAYHIGNAIRNAWFGGVLCPGK